MSRVSLFLRPKVLLFDYFQSISFLHDVSHVMLIYISFSSTLVLFAGNKSRLGVWEIDEVAPLIDK